MRRVHTLGRMRPDMVLSLTAAGEEKKKENSVYVCIVLSRPNSLPLLDAHLARLLRKWSDFCNGWNGVKIRIM